MSEVIQFPTCRPAVYAEQVTGKDGVTVCVQSSYGIETVLGPFRDPDAADYYADRLTGEIQECEENLASGEFDHRTGRLILHRYLEHFAYTNQSLFKVGFRYHDIPAY